MLTIHLGKVKAIGVSNYTVKHLEELLQYATIKPNVLQVHAVTYLNIITCVVRNFMI